MADNQNPTDGGTLRQKLEDALARIKALEGETGTLRSENVLLKSGFGHLSERQQRAVVRELQTDNLEASAENFAKIAEELGYQKPGSTPTPDPTATPGQQPSPTPPGPNDPQPYVNPNQQYFIPQTMGGMGDQPTATPAPSAPLGPWDPDAMRRAAMQGMMQAQQTMNGGQTDGAMTPEEFGRRLNGAQSQEEIMALIQQHGHVVKLMDANDLS